MFAKSVDWKSGVAEILGQVVSQTWASHTECDTSLHLYLFEPEVDALMLWRHWSKKPCGKGYQRHIDIADMLGHKYRYRIDIGKGDIDPLLTYRPIGSVSAPCDSCALTYLLTYLLTSAYPEEEELGIFPLQYKGLTLGRTKAWQAKEKTPADLLAQTWFEFTAILRSTGGCGRQRSAKTRRTACVPVGGRRLDDITCNQSDWWLWTRSPPAVDRHEPICIRRQNISQGLKSA